MLDKAFESIKATRLAGGIFGMTILLLVVLSICATAVSTTIGIWWFALTMFLPIFVLVFYALKRGFNLAEQNPQAAIMDGAELLDHEKIIHENKRGDLIEPEGATVDHSQSAISSDEANREDPRPAPELDKLSGDGGVQ